MNVGEDFEESDFVLKPGGSMRDFAGKSDD